MNKKINIFLVIIVIILCCGFSVQIIEKENQKKELLNHYNQICIEIEQVGDSDAIIGYLPELVNKVMPLLEDKDYIKILKNDGYCDFFRWTMMDVYIGLREEPKSEQYEEALLEMVKDSSQSELLRVSAAGYLNVDKKEYVNDLLVLYDELVSDTQKIFVLKIISQMDKKAAHQLAEEILDGTSARSSSNEELLEYAKKVLVRTQE